MLVVTRQSRWIGTRAVLLATTLSAGGAIAAPAPADAAVDPSQWPRATWPLPADAALEQRVQSLLARMTLEQKVGQIVQGDIGSLGVDDVRRYRLGSVLAGGNSDPGGSYRASADDWIALADAMHAASLDARDVDVAIPLLFGVDAVHGHNNLVGATLFPHNIGLGATRDAELVRRIGEATAAELRASGIHWTFAPALSVPRDDRWGRTYEGYAEDPALVATLGRAAVEGLQGRVGTAEFLDGRHVLATAKHFIADGGTAGGIDQGDARIDEATLRTIHAPGYVATIDAGVQTVMASFSSWNGSKMHGNRALLEDVLRGPLAFGGLVVGDWNAHGQLAGCSNTDCAAAFNAGIDLLMAPDSWRGYRDSALRDARSGAIPRARLDEAVARILRVKLRLGLFDAAKPSDHARALGKKTIGHGAHRALAREAVRASLVLLKNAGRVLPLDPRRSLLVAGDAADDVSRQAGGWTLTWQGTGVTRKDFPGATSIWAGLKQQVDAAGGHAELAADGRWTRRPDAAIVVFGETPYAEFQGDLDSLAFQPGDERALAILRRLRDETIPVVAVFLSGRPLWVNREINAADAFVAAWLPGSEGGGVADVLLRRADGTLAHEFRGTLPYSWPRSAQQTPLNVGDAGYDPLFAYGYGLRTTDDGALAPLPEDSGLRGAAAKVGIWFERGEVAAGNALQFADADGATAVATLPARDRADSLTLAATDHLAQEDALKLQWRKGGSAVAFVAQQPTSLERQANGDVALVLALRADAAPRAPLWLELGCGAACSGRIDLAPTLAAQPMAWRRIAVPLKCLRAAGADLAKVDALRLRSDGAATLALSQAALGTEADVHVGCAQKTGN